MFTEKTIQGKPDYKARHQDRCTHWIARRLFHDALGSSSKRLGLQACSMLSQRISNQTASRNCCCCGCLTKIRLLGRSQGKCLLLLVRSTGREMLDVRGTSTARKCSRQMVLWSQGWHLVFTICMDHLDLRLSCTRMSTTFCLRSRKPPRNTRMLCNILCTSFHLKQQSGLVVYCGRTICRDGNHIKVTQTRSTMSLECMNIDLAGRTLESPLTNAEITGYRSVLGQLLWLGQQSRPDLCVGVSLATQSLSKATLSDVKTQNKLVEQAKSTAEMGVVIPCGVVNLETCSVFCYADAGFANAEHEKSQCGLVCCLTHSPELLKTERFDLSTIISWQSSTIKRVVRSTLAAEGYAVSEGLESAQWFRLEAL